MTAESAAAGGFEHRGVFFESDTDLHDLVLPWVRSAVSDGGEVVMAVAPATRAALGPRLHGHERASVLFAARSDLYDAPGRALAALHRLAQRSKTRRTTVIGEPVLPARDPVQLREWHRLESVLPTVLAGARLHLICLHDIRVAPPAVRETVRRTHPLLLTREGEVPSPDHQDPAAFSAPDIARPLPVPAGVPRSLDIRSDLPSLREDIGALAESTDLPRDRVGDLVTAVNELAANVLEHGAGKGTITLWRSAEWIVCDVFDERGDLTDPLSGYFPTDPLSSRGYGLWITRQLCDFMEVSGGPHGSRIRLHFRTGR
ncbi:MAG: anti-sigma factor RsbA family regulatory protein [Nocardiopsaceae bacterium]|nr:anti-sigma factor RsbA family regulatory protein [Nocardiopsaceae bacterium]